MFNALFHNVTEHEKNEAIERIISHASPRPDFFLMMMLSVSMAVFGVFLGSTVILIGSMLIAPLLFPILSFSLGVITADEELITRSLITTLKSVALGLLAGLFIGILFFPSGANVFAPEIIAGPSLAYVVVAAIAGFAAAFAIVKPHLNDTLPGVAIAVALVPPLANAGIGLSLWNWTVVSNALLLFLVNIIGIVFSSMIVFAMLRFAVKKKIAQEAVKQEEKIVEAETGKD